MFCYELRCNSFGPYYFGILFSEIIWHEQANSRTQLHVHIILSGNTRLFAYSVHIDRIPADHKSTIKDNFMHTHLRSGESKSIGQEIYVWSSESFKLGFQLHWTDGNPLGTLFHLAPTNKLPLHSTSIYTYSHLKNKFLLTRQKSTKLENGNLKRETRGG